MYAFYSTRPTRLYDEPYAVASIKRGKSSVARMRMMTIERQKKSALVAFFFRHPYRAYMIALAVAIGLSAATAWADSPLEPHQQGEVIYLSGGIGSDETEALALVKKDYNLQLTSTDATGHYLAGSRIIIRNAAQVVLIDVVAQGPLFYAHLPNGRYIIESFNGTGSKKKSLTISQGKTARINFSWPVNTPVSVTPKTTQSATVPAAIEVEPTVISPEPITIP